MTETEKWVLIGAAIVIVFVAVNNVTTGAENGIDNAITNVGNQVGNSVDTVVKVGAAAIGGWLLLGGI